MDEKINKSIEKWRYFVEKIKYILIFSFILISTLVNICFIVWFLRKNYSFDISYFTMYNTVITILSIVGVLITFTAINIYSIFNAQLNTERRELDKVKEKYNIDRNEIDSRWQVLNKQFQELESKSECKINDIVAILDRFILDAEISNVINKDMHPIDRTTSIWKLISRIEIREKNIENNDSKKEDKAFESALEALISKIDYRLLPYKAEIEEEKNPYFSKAYKRLVEKLNIIRENEENTIA